MYSEDYCGKHICKCKIGNQVMEYDFAVGVKYYQDNKEEIKEKYFDDPKKVFLGWGVVYSVNGIKQSFDATGTPDAFFKWK
jgi:hypothetical protein